MAVIVVTIETKRHSWRKSLIRYGKPRASSEPPEGLADFAPKVVFGASAAFLILGALAALTSAIMCRTPKLSTDLVGYDV